MTHRIKTPLVALAGMALLGSALSAAVTSWDGTANDGDLFGTAGNWDAGAPGTGAATITLNLIPEPGTYALIGGIFALSCVMVRRRS